jgi:chromosome partitioning protein
MPNHGLAQIDKIIENFQENVGLMWELGVAPNADKSFDNLFTATQVAEMLNKSRVTVSKLTDELKLDPAITAGGRISGYQLEDINRMRDHLGIRPIRKPGDPTARVAIQNFKGGSGKSATTTHFAQHLAIKGYRVLIVDVDPQASTTASCGFVPDRDFTLDDTMLPVFRGEAEPEDVIRPTYFPGIHLIPSCLQAYEAEFALVFAIADADARGDTEQKLSLYYELDELLKRVDPYYDVILMDSPPALSIMSLNILCAANGIFVPAPPMIYDYLSTGQYFMMINKMMGGIAEDKHFNFIKVLPTKVERGKRRQVDFVEVMKDTFGNDITKTAIFSSSNIPNAAQEFKSAYETTGKMKDRVVIEMLDNVFSELETEILKMWPSQQEALVRKGLL